LGAVGRIRKLSDELANQIAAGEVVERPASIVKELVENAIDAQASRISVDIEHGGVSLVRVTDDGEGMGMEDAVLALDRHATSKIRTLDDLFRLASFGFRGEALPSIASVSRLVLRTRTRNADEAFEVEVVGGRRTGARPAGAKPGTTVEVRDLFFNVPARRKFLKATATESAHVGDVLLGAALARPDITFTLARDGRIVREYLRVSSRSERARSVSAGEALSHVITERGSLRIEAMLAAPERARAGSTGLALLVNGRPVRDRILARAVAQAYGSVLEPGRYPVGVMWIDLPTDLVDVNVHPQKAEVRFTDARGVFDAITRELHGSLARAFGLPDLAAQPFARPTAPTLRTLDAAAAQARQIVNEPLPLPETNLFTIAEPERQYGTLRFVAQMRGTFLVCEGPDGLYILDQHAAAERVTFDRLRRAHAGRSVPMQRLLVPEVVEVPAVDVAMFEENAASISALGVEARSAGEAALAVHAVPALLRRADPGRIVKDLASELSRAGGRAFGGAVDLVLATMACHGSIRAGDAVSSEEAQALLAALDDVDFAGHCPHGRPIVMRLPWSELERRVGR
jgi:DNA mismatch repair protein MutL